MSATEPEILEGSFSQKKINHIFHYNNNFQNILKILRNGFAPSYCEEIIGDFEYYIPMVSFCNIPIRDVDLYMRYGRYGIGMSILWALRNNISPVVYVHENTPFKNFHAEINKLHLYKHVEDLISKKINQFLKAETTENSENKIEDKEMFSFLSQINDITIPTLQFFKNWKTLYKGNEIITYQEREWRFVPNLKEDIANKRLISNNDDEFKLLQEKKFREKPHLKEFTLQFQSIEDIKYIMINNDKQRKEVLDTLIRRFSKDEVQNAILSGNLLIIKDEIVKNDF